MDLAFVRGLPTLYVDGLETFNGELSVKAGK
jgi:hypothetical protein